MHSCEPEDIPQPSKGETETTSVTLNDYFRFDLAEGRVLSPGVYGTAFDRQSDAKSTQWTQELQRLGQAADGRLDWIVGGFYFDERADQALFDNLPIIFLLNLSPTLLDTDTRSWALYGHATWKFTEALSATLGVRTTEDQKEFTGVTPRSAASRPRSPGSPPRA